MGNKKNPDRYQIEYQNCKGISWTIGPPIHYGSPVYSVIRHTVHYICAHINLKEFTGAQDNVSEITINNLKIIEEKFNQEAKKISKVLGDLSEYYLEHVEYIVNFDLYKMKIPCTYEQILALFQLGNIPFDYKEFIEYNEDISYKFDSPLDYLQSKYDIDLKFNNGYTKSVKTDSDNQNFEKMNNILQFVIKPKYNRPVLEP